MMGSLAELKRDTRGGAGVKFLIMAALVAMPALYPGKTVRVLKSAHSSWEQLWIIEGLS